MGADLERLFRLEAGELIESLEQGLLELEKAGERSDLIAQCYRFAHTLKGAARTVRRTDLSELAHTMEEALSPYRESGDPIEPDCVSDLLKLLQVIRADLHPVAAPRPQATAEPVPVLDADRFETVRVELKDMDALLESLAEARTQLRGLREYGDKIARAQRVALELIELEPQPGSDPRASGAALQRPRAVLALEELRSVLTHTVRELGSRLEHAELELGQAHERVGTLRLMRAGTIFPALELAARDAAQLLGKSVELVCSGSDVRIEANILSGVREALIHMVRNAVDHGIEPTNQRLLLGKEPTGRVHVRAERRGRRVAFLCSDDGAGIDLQAVRAAAIERRALTEEEAQDLDADSIQQLIFRPGISTRREVTEVSGRGVGLDVVRATAARWSGEVSVASERGQGSTIGLIVPTSFSSLSALVVVVEGGTVLLPLDAIRSTARIPDSVISEHPDGETVLYEGRAVPFLRLAPLLGRTASPRERWSVLFVQSGPELIAVGADRLAGTTEVLLKPLPPEAGPQPLLAGAALDAQGDPVLILDPRGLLAAHRGSANATRRGPARALSPILVIDDSLTTRTLEQSVLEIAGYEVELASSGEEGLVKARARRYGLFIVDIEMPGMNGLEFTKTTRADPQLREVPVMLVTSLSSYEHRRRGVEAGASAYIVKSEFDQSLFLARVRELLR